MPGCVLRVQSKTLDVDSLVKASGLTAIVTYRKGHPRGSTSVWRQSGFNVDVSRADGDLEKQARDAVRFLRRHAGGLDRLQRCRNLGGMTLDFGLYDRASDDTPWPSYRIPATLIEIAARRSLEIELSFYGSGEPTRPMRPTSSRTRGSRDMSG